MVKGDTLGRFTVSVNGCLQTYNDFNDIPNRIESILHFEPNVPTGPHTMAQHAEIEHWNYRLQMLMARCK